MIQIRMLQQAYDLYPMIINNVHVHGPQTLRCHQIRRLFSIHKFCEQRHRFSNWLMDGYWFDWSVKS